MSTHIIDATIRLKDKLSAPLEKAKEKLKSSTRVIDKFSNSLKKSSKTFLGVGANLMKSITLPLTALGTTSVVSFASFEQAMLGVKNVTGATGKEFNKLEQLALDMSMSTSKSAVECANGIEYLGLAGWSTAQIMENYSEILRLSEATSIDLATASDLVTDSLSAFGKDASFTTEYLNKLALTSTKANANTQQLLESIVTCGGMAKNLGLNIDELSATLGILANRGIKGTEAGTSLNSIFVNLLGTTSTTRDALSKLGVEVYNAQGKFIGWENLLNQLSGAMSSVTDEQRDMLSAALGGKTQLDTLLALLEGYNNEYHSLLNGMEDIYTFDDMGNKITILEKMQQDYQKTVIGQFEQLKSQVGFIFIKVGKVINENFGGALGAVNEKVSQFIEWCKALSPETKENIIIFGLLALAIAPISIIIGKAVGGIANGIKTFNNFNKAMKASGGFIKAFSNPMNFLSLKILGIVAILALIGVAIWALVKNWDKIKEVFVEFGNKIATAVESFFVAIGMIIAFVFNKVVDSISWVWENLKTIWNNIKEFLLGIWDIIKTSLHNYCEDFIAYWQNLWQTAKDLINTWIDSLNEQLENIKAIFNGIIDFITGIFTGNWEQAWNGVKNIFTNIWDSLVLAAKTPLNLIIDLVNGAIRGINSLADFKLPNFLGGKQISLFKIPEIPKLYKGSMHFTGGTAMIHDKGPEVVDLPNGSRVYPNSDSLKMAYEDGKNSNGRNVIIDKLADSIIVREDADIDKIIDRLVDRLEREKLNYA